MLVHKSLWSLPSPDFSLKPREANHFPEAGAIPSVFSFRPHVSVRTSETFRAKWEFKAGKRMEWKHAVGPRDRLWAKWRGNSLLEAARKEERRGCSAVRVFVGGCNFRFHLAEHQKCTQGACEVTMYRQNLSVEEARLSWTAINCGIFLFSIFWRAMLQLELRESKCKPKESHPEQSRKHRR